MASIVICSTAFQTLGRAQAKAFGAPDLPLAVIPHPFGSRTRDEIKTIAAECSAQIARILQQGGQAASRSTPDTAASSRFVEAPWEQEEFDAFCRSRAWSDGLPLVAPTEARVARMLAGTSRAPSHIVGAIAPSYAFATVERIAANAVMTGCDPRFLPVVIAALEATCDPVFNLQAVQTTTNPATPWIIVNGPLAASLEINGGINCLGQGSWANAAIGRAVRLVLQNIGGAVPGTMDQATHGQPGKFAFCCAENEAANPWEPLHVERGMTQGASAVTVVCATGTLNVNSHTKNADELLRVFADTLAQPTSNDYWYSGAPFLIVSPEHAEILHRAGLSKADVKQRLWTQSKLHASRLSDRDYLRPEHARRAELGEVTRDTLLPITKTPAEIGIVVAGGPGTHSVYVPGFGNSHPATRAITP